MLRKTAVLAVAAVVLSGVPAFAQGKDECLLASRNCRDQVDTIQQKMVRLNGEIAKGTRVYNAQELKVLQGKLREVNAQLDDLLKPGH